ncbi:MAG: malonate decarboxylase holo-[acyl-carrier-protein] synthase [Phyllobacteriaceae bacterium]|nr:malonate decarboxylase holo-[acyl-carrier-protein] synthase [Phyllobacteriaceae bacterium]
MALAAKTGAFAPAPAPERHVMVEIVPEGRAAVEAQLADGLLPMHRSDQVEAQVRSFFAAHAIPGIVCAPKGPLPEGAIQIGVSFPFRVDGVRVRSAACVSAGELGRRQTPWDVAAGLSTSRLPVAAELLAVIELGRTHAVDVGFFGSAALQAWTGLPYMEASSDVDIVATARSSEGLCAFHTDLVVFTQRYSRRYDVEVAVPGGLGVKLSELVSDVSTVLGRGIEGVRLVDRRRLLEEIDKVSPAVATP